MISKGLSCGMILPKTSVLCLEVEMDSRLEYVSVILSPMILADDQINEQEECIAKLG